MSPSPRGGSASVKSSTRWSLDAPSTRTPLLVGSSPSTMTSSRPILAIPRSRSPSSLNFGLCPKASRPDLPIGIDGLTLTSSSSPESRKTSRSSAGQGSSRKVSRPP